MLSHQPVASKFFQDENLIKTWFQFLSHFQGMNLAKFIKKGMPHVEQETETHIGAFTAGKIYFMQLIWPIFLSTLNIFIELL